MSVQQEGRRTHFRWVILGVICLMYLITYLDRTNISVAAPSISSDFGFSKVQMGVIFSSFVWAYAIGQVPGGWLGDRFGPRRVLASIVTWWSIFTIITAQAATYAAFIVIRFLFGLGEAGAFPTATRAMQLWFRKQERGFVQGITHSCSRFGAAIVPPIAATIILHYGWRAVFYAFGGLGILWAILFFLVYRNIPEEHRWVNRAELTYIRGVDAQGNLIPPVDTLKKPQVPWRKLLSSGNMWFIMMAYFCYNYAFYFYSTWLPTYLQEYRHFTLLKMGFFASIPLLAGVIGDTLGGLITDRIYRNTRNARFSRKVVAVPALVVAAIALIPAATTANPYVAVACLAVSLFFLEGMIGPQWCVPMDVGGAYSGTVSGMMSMGGNLAGVVSPIVFGALVQGGSWTAPFYVEAAVLILGACIWLFLLDPERSVVGSRAPAPDAAAAAGTV